MSDRIADLIPSEDDFDRFMDALQTVIKLEAGQTLLQSQVDDIKFVERWYSDQDEKATEAYSRGFEDGRANAAGAEMAEVLSRLDAARSDLAVEKALSHFYRKSAEGEAG